MNITRIGNKVLNSGFWRKLAPDNPTDMAAKIALISTTTKDAMNCYYYTTQSYKNEKIPKENRTFVAVMDAVNGILNVSIQLLMGTIVERKSGVLFDKLFGKHFNAEAAQRNFQKLMDDKAKGLHNLNFSAEQIAERLKVNQKWGKGGFKVLAVLFITQVFCKRVITPLIATPVTSFIKTKIEKRKQAKEETPQIEENKKQKPEQSKENTINAIQTPMFQAAQDGTFREFEKLVYNK